MKESKMGRYILFAILLFYGVNIFADDMTFTTKTIPAKSGLEIGIMPKNMPDELGYKGSETTITPLFLKGSYLSENLYFEINLPLVINPDDTTDDIVLNTILLNAGYIFLSGDIKVSTGLQFTPALNIGANEMNKLSHNISPYLNMVWSMFDRALFLINLQYYHSLGDVRKYSGLYITRANTGFSTEIRLEYLFPDENISVLSDLLLHRDLMNGVSNMYFGPGVKFFLNEYNTIFVSLLIPLYDSKFVDRFGSGLNLYYDRRF